MTSGTLHSVKPEDLKPGMLIRGITQMSFDFAMLDANTIGMLLSTFPGAVARLKKPGGDVYVPIAQIKPFDHLVSIEDIPTTLAVAQVTVEVGAKLAQQGFLEFKVSDGEEVEAPAIIGAASEAVKKASRERVSEAKQMLEKVEVATAHRETSTVLIQEMFDQGRNGKFITQAVEKAVDEIMAQTSSPALKAMAGLKCSDQTYAHCVDMAVILQETYCDIQRASGKPVNQETKKFVLFAGYLHDIGKSEVPKDILESTTRFPPDSREMMLMRNHTVYGSRILTDLGMHKTIINVAHYHHVKVDSTLFTNYPEVGFDQVLPITRLASIVDVYQALIGKRKYKKNWVPGKAIEYLLKLKGSEFDPKMLDHFIRAIGRYPVGSLVKLSNGYLAFVLRLGPEDQPERPLVGVVENPGGAMLGKADIVDLVLHPELSIAEVVDHYEHYNQSDEQAFNIFRTIIIQ